MSTNQQAMKAATGTNKSNVAPSTEGPQGSQIPLSTAKQTEATPTVAENEEEIRLSQFSRDTRFIMSLPDKRWIKEPRRFKSNDFGPKYFVKAQEWVVKVELYVATFEGLTPRECVFLALYYTGGIIRRKMEDWLNRQAPDAPQLWTKFIQEFLSYYEEY